MLTGYRIWVLFLLLPFSLLAQPKKNADSIRRLLPTLKTASEQADALVSLGWWVIYDSLRMGLNYANRGLELSQKNNLPDIESDAWNVIGTIYQDLGDYSKALDAHLKAIKMRTSLKRDALLRHSYLNISLVYKSLADTIQSLKYQMEAADIFKKLDNKKGYTIENSAPCCSVCNFFKRHYTEKKFIEHVHKISDFQRSKK